MLLGCPLLLLAFSFPTEGLGLRNKRQGEGVTSSCTTPENKAGQCINVRSCPRLAELLELVSAYQDMDAITYLRRSKCGGYAQVCCEIQETTYVNNKTTDQSPPEGVCGKSAVRQTDKVVGGHPADLGAWPWIAALGVTERGSWKPETHWICGGSLINKRYVLTAAHCISLKPSVVRLGEHDLASESDGATPVDYKVERTVVHEGYRSRTNDIALIRVDRDVTFTGKISPICLPSIDALRNNNFERKYPFLAGWGETIYKGPSSTILLQVQVPVVDNDRCKNVYSRLGVSITDTHLCAGEQAGGKDSCRGDSGGPLMFPQTGIYYQIGIIAFGFGCAEPGYPGVYTRVSSYLDWIKTNTGGLS